MLFVSDRIWNRIRDRFTPEEIDALRSVARGRILCPAGQELEADRLEAALSDKLVRLISVYMSR